MHIKESLKKHGAKLKQYGGKIAGAVTGAAFTFGTAIQAWAADSEGVSAAKELLTEAQKELNIANIAGIIAAGIGAVLGLFVAWWGVRKLFNMLVQVFKKGKVKL